MNDSEIYRRRVIDQRRDKEKSGRGFLIAMFACGLFWLAVAVYFFTLGGK